MQLKNVMNRDVEFVTPDLPLREAARKMSAHNRCMLPVCRAGQVIGMLTLRDLTVRATAQGRDPATTKVGEVMTREVVYCLEHQDAREAAGIMRGRHIVELPVLDMEKRLVGIVSSRDLNPNAVRPRLGRASAGNLNEPKP